MSTTNNPVFTIGHSNHAQDVLIDLLRRHGVTALADVRSAPYSRFNPQFNRESLARSLKSRGIEYVYLGDGLGGRSDDPACYEDGRVRYDRVAEKASFQHALDRVVRGAANHRIVLLCAERDPLECHRTLLVAPALAERGVEIAHIHANGRLEPHGEAMDRLLNRFNLHPNLFPDQPQEKQVAEAIELQAKRVAFVDKNLATTSEASNP